MISSDSNVVPTPNVGDDVSTWTTVANDDVITVANGKNVGVAEVDSTNKVVKFVNVVAANVDYVAATAATLTSTVEYEDDNAVNTTANNKSVTVAVDGGTPQTVTLTNVTSKNDLLAAFNAVTGVTATWDNNNIKLVGGTTGTTLSITVAGTDANAVFGTNLMATGTSEAN